MFINYSHLRSCPGCFNRLSTSNILWLLRCEMVIRRKWETPSTCTIILYIIPTQKWILAFYGRLFFAVVGMLVVKAFPEKGVTTSYFFLVILTTVASSFCSTVQFVSMGSFFTQISDPRIGGTYMTLVSNVFILL